MHLTGLGTEQEVLMILLPPLIERNILAGQFVVDFVVSECNKTQAESDYRMCFEVYSQLLALVTRGARELLTCKVLAVCFELLSTSWPVHGLGRSENIEYKTLLKLLKANLSVELPNRRIQKASCAEGSLKQFRTSCLNKIRQLYFGQGRQKDFKNAMKMLEAGTFVGFAQEVDARESAEMHSDSVLELEDCRLFGLYESQLGFSHGSDPSFHDVLRWTTRHYSASLDPDHFKPRKHNIELLDIARRNPFHYSTFRGLSSNWRLNGQTGSQAIVDRDGIPWLMRVLVNTTLSQDGSMALQIKLFRPYLGPDQLSQVDNFGRTCIHIAIQMAQTELILCLLKCLAFDFNARDKEGKSLLMYACLSSIADPSKLDIVSPLLQRGAEVDAIDIQARTALFHSASAEPDSETQSIDISVESGQSSTEGTNKKSPRQKESRFSNALKVAEILLKHDANVEFHDRYSRTPLVKARELWEKGKGNSPLMVNLLEEGLENAKERKERDKITRYYKPLRLPRTASSSSFSSYTSY